MLSLPSKNKRVLCVYSASQTYTSTVFEHVSGFGKYSRYSWQYADYGSFNATDVNIGEFDAVVFHYSVRLPFGQISPKGIDNLKMYLGKKVLFIQDEYDNTDLVKQLIATIGFDLVFSVAPPHSLNSIYAPDSFARTRFVSNLTGYVPDDLATQGDYILPPSSRHLVIAYRGRRLPIRYGRLGQEKVEIGRGVKDYCAKMGIPCDIAWEEHDRIYGAAWYDFIKSTKAMLGSESGSNVFDWKGDLQSRIDAYKAASPSATDSKIYEELIAPHEHDGLMNQVSPRIFEMIASKTIMILFEGSYSGVLVPYRHYFPLKKDFSNIDSVFKFLAAGSDVDAMAETAYKEIIDSEKYSYKKFVEMVDVELGLDCSSFDKMPASRNNKITKVPIRALPPFPSYLMKNQRPYAVFMRKLLLGTWGLIPIRLRPWVKRGLGRV